MAVTRQQAEAVARVSIFDWTAIAETMHLRSATANAGRLAGAVGELDAGLHEA